jgi:hypothetical protein
MAESIAELRALTDEDLIRRHDQHAPAVVVATGHYLGELRRREAARSEARMIALTEKAVTLTRGRRHSNGADSRANDPRRRGRVVALLVAAVSLVASLR